MMTNQNINEKKQPPGSREDLLLEIAELLKTQRSSKELSVEVISGALNLRKNYLESLESGDWSNMPGEVYALGFLRQYADYLGLDLNQQIEKLKSGHYQLTKPLTFPDPPVAPNKTWVIIAALGFLLIFVVFNILKPNTSPTPLPSQLMQDSATTMTAPVQVETKTTEDQAGTAEQENITTTETETSLPVEPVLNEQVAEQPTLYNYELTAVTEDVWLQLHEVGEPPVLVREALLKKGESMSVSHPTALSLTCGNSPALEVLLNKKRIVEVGQLGQKGKVLHDYLLQEIKGTP